MKDVLEHMQKALRTIENRIKSQEQRIWHLEQLIAKKHPTEWQPPESSVPSKEKILTKKSFNWQRFELNVGTYLLQSIGVIIFLVGMGFLLKHSIEQGWMGPLGRILFGFTTATCAVGLGEYLKTRYQQWALACSAGGIVLYYLSSYSAYAFYSLISLETTFVLFCATTFGAVLLALWHNSVFVGVFSVLGGFLTPVLLQVYDKNPLLLMSYLVVLAGGYSILSYKKQWFSLSYLSFALMVWSLKYMVVYPSSDAQLLFLGANWIIYGLVPYVYVLIYRPIERLFEPLLIALSAVITFFELWMTGTSYYFSTKLYSISWLFYSTELVFNRLSLVFAFVYFLLLSLLVTRWQKNIFVFGTIATISVISCVGFIVTQWHGYQMCAALHIFGLLVYALSFICMVWIMRIASYTMWALSSWYLIALTANQTFKHGGSLIFNEINSSYLLVFLSFVGALWLSLRYKVSLTRYEKNSIALLKSAVTFTPIVWMHTPLWSFPAIILGIALYSLGLFIIGLYHNDRLIRMWAYAACVLAVVYFGFKYFFGNILNPYWAFDLNMLFFAFATIFVSAYFLIQMFRSVFEDKEFDIVRGALYFLIPFSIFAWIRTNIILQFDVLENWGGPSILQRLTGYSIKNDVLVRTGVTNVMLALFYTLYSVILIAYGLIRKNRMIRYLGLAIIALALKILFEIIWKMPYTAYRIVAFLVVGGLLIGASFLYQNMKQRVD